MKIRLVVTVLATPLLFSLTACSTPTRRAAQRPVAFGRLAPSDKQLVLHGKVRPGLEKDAVYIAWGKPDWRFEDGQGKHAAESWIYERQLSTYAPMSSYDTISSPNVYGARPPFGFQPGFGYGGVPNTGFIYSPRAILTDVQYKRANFIDDSLQSYEIRRGARHITVVASESTSPIKPQLAQHHRVKPRPAKHHKKHLHHTKHKKARIP